MRYTAENLVVHPALGDGSLITRVDPALAGWTHLSFEARRLRKGETFSWDTKDTEVGLVMLSGTLDAQSPAGAWHGVGGRKSVFEGLPHALYFSRRTKFTLTAQTNCEFGMAWAASDQDHPARWVTPDQVSIEIRGGGNATRQINNMIAPGFNCHRLVMVEVYTPGGNWSSYPPHKHDIHRTNAEGKVLEANLEETYFYKIDRPEGYAFQRVYTDAHSPMQQAGSGFDAVVRAGNNDVVLIPAGYHPVCSPPGYTTYYLNSLAGSAQSLANFEDPRYAWVKETYKGRDARVPIF
ncbi:MAG TPA: 5-deoxy-glucuronate isomerase [Thermoflexales bacterium]|nr:5-deoxy-glucuronate isomerase [Thermoflexales bacterium]HQZ21110.1 5-deoxy-glucuronate isomerase [Thermoflexales bacterium]